MIPIFLFYPIQSNVVINSGAPACRRTSGDPYLRESHRAEKIWLSRDCPYAVHTCTTWSACTRVCQGPVFAYITIFGLKMEKKKHQTVFKRQDTYKNLPSEEYLGNFSFLRRSKDEAVFDLQLTNL